jgi:hypothetical protein
MRNHLQSHGKVNVRKLILFALACSRNFLHLLSDVRSRQAVTFAERLVEGEGTREGQERAINAAGWAVVEMQREKRTEAAIAAARAAVRLASASLSLYEHNPVITSDSDGAWQSVHDASFFTDAKDQCALWRDLFGSPFVRVTVDPAWLTWNHGVAAKLAATIYQARDFSRLRMLADALEDAGCTDANLLDHLRGPGPHVRGCWALDLVLGKE